MRVYDVETKTRIRVLRKSGLTYTEIQQKMNMAIPKPSLTYICKDVVMSDKQKDRIKQLVASRGAIGRQAAILANKRIFAEKILGYQTQNKHLAKLVGDRDIQLMILATLYLGEGSKWHGSRTPKLVSTDPNIILLYMNLIYLCYGVTRDKFWARIQCRADQDQTELLSYWSKITGISKTKFYPCYVDKRTIGKPTRKVGYKGVCAVGSAGTHIQLELAEISSIIGEAIRGISAAG